MALLLPATNTKVQLVTSAAGDIEVYSSWLDNNAGTITGGIGLTSVPTATTTDIVAAPNAGILRNVKRINITNNHATVSNIIEVLVTDGTTPIELISVTLLSGETLCFDASGRWYHRDVNGAEYVSASQNPVTIKSLGADYVNSTVTPGAIAGLTVPLQPGNYLWKAWIRYQTAALTTGVRFDANFTGTVTSFVWNQYWNVGINANSSDAPDQDHIAALGGVLSAFSSRAKGTAGRGVTLSVDTLNADMLMMLEGVMVVTVAGDFQILFGSEIAASAATAKAGSMLMIAKG